MEYFPPDNEAPEGEDVAAPEIVLPNSVDEGNVPPPADPIPEAHYHEYSLDVADTQLSWTPGAPLNTQSILQYIIDRGYMTIGVQPEVDPATLQETGIVIVRTNPLDDPDLPGEEIPALEWEEYAGTRYAGVVQTDITWTDTAEGAITAKPDLLRLGAFWLYLESRAVTVQQITGNWNFTTPDMAPASPVLSVFARGGIDPAIYEPFLYASIDPNALNAFSTQWSAVDQETVMYRRFADNVEVNQFEFSTPRLWVWPGVAASMPATVPFDALPRPGDIFQITTLSDPYNPVHFQRNTIPTTELNQSLSIYWVQLPSTFTLTNEESLSLGRDSQATAVRSTALGFQASATAVDTTAIGNEATASDDRSTAVGAGAAATGENALATGYSAEASELNTTAVGSYTLATGGGSTAVGHLAWSQAANAIAIGHTARVQADAHRSGAIGYLALAPTGTLDTLFLRYNDVKQDASYGPGRTRYALKSPDGTYHYISITDTGRISIDDVEVGSDAVLASVMTTRGDLITQSAGGVPARLARGSAGQILATEPGGLFLQWQNHVSDEVSFVLENYFPVGTFGSTPNTASPAGAISGTSRNVGPGTRELTMTVKAQLARSVNTGGALIQPRIDGVVLSGTDMYAYIKAPLTALDYGYVERTFIIPGVSGGNHTFDLLYRGDSTAGTTYITNAVIHVDSKRTA